MKYFGEGLSEQHKALQKIIRKPDQLEAAKELFLAIHASLHSSDNMMTALNEVDALLNDLTVQEYTAMAASSDETIAWVLWHTARIEDLTMNYLVARQEQLFDSMWQQAMGIEFTDTGNAWSDDEILQFSHQVDINALLNYCRQVSRRTRTIVSELQAGDMRRQVKAEDLDKIRAVKGVSEHEDSIWLLDYWGKKDVAGLLLMPPTRHVMLHLNDCCKWKLHFRTHKRIYRE